ncbi:MAG: aminoacyl-tRNA hydrolase, partial [Candidatus Omnitrophica bacterium]|nr:aminoacyl-tRNA hydrolase [Candidatus Omnitrophota bacterium]
MKLIVGLGNPGLSYAGSRHNIGFEVVKYFAKLKKVVLKKEKGIKALSGKGDIGSGVVVLSLPLTFMNLSGEAVKLLLKKYRVALFDLLVVCDDLDLEFGRIKMRPSGSSAGHRGIDSVINSLNTNEFSRLRIGIGRPNEGIKTSDFVLSRFNRGEKADIPEIIDRAVACCSKWIEEGAACAMGSFNRKDIKK